MAVGRVEKETDGVKNAEAQRIAKETMGFLCAVLRPGMNLKEVRAVCEKTMREKGADSFWYWDVGAFVFAGDETAVSVSGREYETADRLIEENDLLTIDLSPQIGDVWGDYARTIVVERGKVCKGVQEIGCEEWREGLWAEERLHEEMRAFVSAETTFEQLYAHMNRRIVEMGFVNLDFAGNLGHSIERRKADRIYIEKGNKERLSGKEAFTFEPHIGKTGSKYGYKKENIYYFDGGTLKEL